MKLVSAAILSAVLFFSPTHAYASGNLSTSTDSQDGQVLVKGEDGVLYLSTEVNGDAKRATTSGTYRLALLGNVEVAVPTGFARDFGGLINAILSFVMVIATLLVFMYLIWGAFDWITSGGDKTKLDSARQKLFAAVVGLIIVASSYAILMLVVQFLGFKNIDDIFDQTTDINNEQLQDTSIDNDTEVEEASEAAELKDLL